ncbi:MAG: FixJ family two-component response regulator [Alphaproteobacteria bacterium]|jgi:FixJ family two-component response regulator
MENILVTQSKSDAIVHVVDDDDAVLDSLGLLLTSIGINNCTYSDAQAFIDAYNNPDFDRQYGCILMDIRMPVMSGIECQYRLEKLGCNLPIIFVTGHGDVQAAVETMKHGAFDFIQKPYREQALIDAIQKALQKNANEQSQMKKVIDTKAKLETLSNREAQILEAILDGKANKVIAIELSLSQRTIEIHRAHVMEKMAVKSLAELVKIVLDAL